MSTPHPEAGFTPTGTIANAVDRRRVVFATVVGTTVDDDGSNDPRDASGSTFSAAATDIVPRATVTPDLLVLLDTDFTSTDQDDVLELSVAND